MKNRNAQNLDECDLHLIYGNVSVFFGQKNKSLYPTLGVTTDVSQKYAPR